MHCKLSDLACWAYESSSLWSSLSVASCGAEGAGTVRCEIVVEVVMAADL